MPPASFIEWGGQYENLQAAQARLAIVVPVCFALVLLLLFMALGGWVSALAVFSAIPMALAGGVFALALRGPALLGIGRSGLHRALGRGGAQRSRHDDRDPAASRQRGCRWTRRLPMVPSPVCDRC